MIRRLPLALSFLTVATVVGSGSSFYIKVSDRTGKEYKYTSESFIRRDIKCKIDSINIVRHEIDSINRDTRSKLKLVEQINNE